MASIIVKWLDRGVYFGKEDTVKRKFINEGELEASQKLTIQLSSKKGSKANIWKAEVVSNAQKEDTRPRESIKKTVPVHIKKSFEKLSNDDFTFELSAAPRVRREEKLQKRLEKMRREVEEEEKLFPQRREKRRREEEKEEERWKKRREEREEYPISQ